MPGMGQPPDFLTVVVAPIRSEETFRPSVTGRRGEFVAWAGVLSLAVLSAVMAWRTQRLPTLALGLLVFFLVAAAFTTLGSALDRRTSMRVSPDGLHYQSPLRTISLEWGQIEDMQIVPAGKGWRVLVHGDNRQLRFRILAPPEEGASEAFPAPMQDGERLTALILGAARLGRPEEGEKGWVLTRRDVKLRKGKLPPGSK